MAKSAKQKAVRPGHPRPRSTSKPSMRARRDYNNPIFDLIEEAGDALRGDPTRPKCPQYEPKNVFKTLVYNKVREWLRNGRDAQVKSYCYNRQVGSKRISFERNPFNWVLQALHETKDFKGILYESNVNAIGWQLMHAHRHNIDPALLVGFLYQTAASSAWKQKEIKSTGDPLIEPWFKEYLARG